MRSILFLFISALSLNLIAQTDTTSDKIQLNCFAVNGLFLRKHPSKDATKILKIPYGESMNIMKKSGIVESIAGFEGEWIQVRFKDSIGYLFDVYTSKFPSPKLRKVGYSHILDYIVGNFKITGGDKVFDIDDSSMSTRLNLREGGFKDF